MAKVDIEDLSGTYTSSSSNPYDGLISATNEDPKLMQDRYQQHRIARNEQQKAKILAEDFSGWILDEHLVKLEGIQKDDNYKDPRNCLVFWARPPQKVRHLIEIIHQKLQDAAPDIWLMPSERAHMTAMEITHSLTAAQIDKLVDVLQPVYESIADYPRTHRARLVKPMLSYDSAALALSFVPAAGETLSQGRKLSDDNYTYHHFRRDLHTKLTEGGIDVSSRYVVPSAHITVARFKTPNPFGGDPTDKTIGTDATKRKRWIKELEMINKWLEAEYWPKDNGKPIMPGGEWVVGEEKGLDFHKGTLWYGGGETVYLGKGF